MAEKIQKKGKQIGSVAENVFSVPILGHPSTFTFNLDGGRQGDGTVTDITGRGLHFHKRVQILNSHPHNQVWQLKVTWLLWSNQEWGPTGHLWGTVTTSKIAQSAI